MKTAIVTYGVLVYCLFLGTFLYLVGFAFDLMVPKSMNSGASVPLSQALPINLALLGLFAVQHGIMARATFKRWWTSIIPEAAERSTFVLATCLVLALLVICWQPTTTAVWSIETPALRMALWALAVIGWAVVLVSTFLIDHFHLFGLQQIARFARGLPQEGPRFREIGFYRYVRHPLMLGFLLAFWATPEMTLGHLSFAATITVYVLIALQVEERSLVAAIGPDYESYRGRVPMLLPWRGPRRETRSTTARIVA